MPARSASISIAECPPSARPATTSPASYASTTRRKSPRRKTRNRRRKPNKNRLPLKKQAPSRQPRCPEKPPAKPQSHQPPERQNLLPPPSPLNLPIESCVDPASSLIYLQTGNCRRPYGDGAEPVLSGTEGPRSGANPPHANEN